MSNIIKFIRGAEADILVLNQGEPAFTTDTHKVFIGDGAENHQLAMITDTQNKLNWVYPQDYATGSGTVGDPWAGDCINDAITAASAGDTIYLREGYYETGLINITKTINLIGAGIQKTFIVSTSTTTNALWSDEDDYVTLKGFTLDCSSQTATEASGINIHDAEYLTIENVEVHDAGKEAINSYENNHSTFKNLWLHDNHEHSIHPGSDTLGRNMYNTYENIYCYDNTLYGFYDRGDGEQGHDIEDCHNTYNNIQAWGNGGRGIAIEYQKGALISNLYAEDNGSIGIEFYHLEHSAISNCVAMSNGITSSMEGMATYWGVYLTMTNITVLNNYSGFMLYECDDVSITNLYAYDDQSTAVQNFGLVLDDDHACTNIRITNYKFTPNDFGAILGTTAGIVSFGVAAVGTPVAGDVMYHDGTNWVKLAKGTANQRLKMNAEATAPEWDTLTEADISDLGAYIGSLIEDPAPELGGDLDAADKYITGAGRISFTQELDNGSKTASFSIYFITDQKQKVTLTANTMTLTLDTTSMGVGNYLLKIVNGGLATLTWASESGSIYFPGGTDPVLTASGTDIVAFYFDGTNWYGMASLDFK